MAAHLGSWVHLERKKYNEYYNFRRPDVALSYYQKWKKYQIFAVGFDNCRALLSFDQGECGRSNFNFVRKVVVLELGPVGGAASECHSCRVPNQIPNYLGDLCQQRISLQRLHVRIIFKICLNEVLEEKRFNGRLLY